MIYYIGIATLLALLAWRERRQDRRFIKQYMATHRRHDPQAERLPYMENGL